MSMSFTSEQITKFSKYSDIFIETGAFEGGTVFQVLACGFKIVHTIELSDILYKACKDRFDNSNLSNVFLYHGDSSLVLPAILKELTSPAVVWMDGHHMAADERTAKGLNESKWKENPLRFELEAFKIQTIKNHLLLIDDMDFAGKWEFDYFTKDQIIASVKEINPQYKISFMNGHCNKKDTILVATPPEFNA